MISALIFGIALIDAEPDPKLVLNRVKEYLKAESQSYSFSADLRGRPVTSGKLILQKPSSMWTELEGKGFHFIVVQKGDQAIALDKLHGNYDTRSVVPRLEAPFVDTSALVIFPGLLVDHSVERYSLNMGGWTYVGSKRESNLTLDHIQRISEPDDLALDLYVDQSGAIRRYFVSSVSHAEDDRIGFDIRAEKTSIGRNLFDYDIPKGYVPLVIPENKDPIQPGCALPILSVLNVASNKMESIGLKGKKSLVLIVGTDCHPSQLLMKALNFRAIELEQAGANLTTLAVGSSRPGKGITYWDKDGSVGSAISILGTPFLMLVDENARLVQAWFGHDPANFDNMCDEIFGALATKGD